MAQFETIDGLDVHGRPVLVRVDLNVPMQDGEITDVTRIARASETIGELSRKGARTVVLAHFGRPKGSVHPAMSLEPVARALSEALDGTPVAFAQDCIGETARSAIDALSPGGVVLLENLRFHAGEEKNEPSFADALASLGEIYVNDAFSCSHRAHASVVGLAARLPAYAGRLMQGELEALDSALGNAQRPAAALVGGAKVSTKLDVIGEILPKVDRLIIGGGMANTFLAARGVDVGKSLCEHDLVDTARAIAAKAESAGVTIVLPVDVVCARELRAQAETRTLDVSAVGADEMILDIGPESAAMIATTLAECRTLLWNGPMGAFEIEPFDTGTNAVARKAAELTDAGKLRTVAGGGDTVAALAHAGVLERFSYVSTAGGAFLEWLEGKELPGVAALSRGSK